MLWWRSVCRCVSLPPHPPTPPLPPQRRRALQPDSWDRAPSGEGGGSSECLYVHTHIKAFTASHHHTYTHACGFNIPLTTGRKTTATFCDITIKQFVCSEVFAVICHCNLIKPLTFLSKAPRKPIFSPPNLPPLQPDLLSMPTKSPLSLHADGESPHCHGD